MPDQKLSQLTSATTVAGSDQLYIVQSGQSKRATASQLPINTATAAALDGKEVTGTAAAAITGHLAAADPHPTYLTQTEAGTLYAPLVSVHDPVSLGATVTDVLGLTGQQLTADDPGAGADRLLYWDHSAGRLRYLALGSGLTITGTTIDAAGGTGGYPAFAAPTGFTVTGSGTASITLSFATGYSLPTTASQASWDAAYSERLRWDGGATGLNAVTARASLGLGSLATQSGTFSGTSSGTNTGDQDLSGLVVRANNLSDLASAATARTNLGLGSAAQSATTDFATAAQGALAATAVQPAALTSYVQTTDGRLTDAREWSADTVTQAAAQAGTETTRRAWTVERVWQAAAAWWQSISGATGRSLAGASNPATARTVLELGTAATTDATAYAAASHNQSASTITGLASVATSGAYTDLSGRPTLGTAAALNTGTAAGNVVALDGSARLPAVDGSQLTNLPGGTGGGSPGGTGSELQFRSSSSAFGAVTGSSVDGSGNITLGARLGLSVNNALSSSALLLSGTWITSGGTSTTTKPAVLIEPAGTTSSGWSTAGSALGINCPSGFTGWPIAVHQNGSLRFGIDLTNNRTHINNTGTRGDFYFDKGAGGGDPRMVCLNSTTTFAFTGLTYVAAPVFTSTATTYVPSTNNETAIYGYGIISRRAGGAGAVNQIWEGGTRGLFDEFNKGLTIRAIPRGTAPSATPTYSTGSELNLLGGDAFTNATNAANGGPITINGGIGYGTGVAGNVVVCDLRGFFQFGREITVAQLPAASATLRRAEAVVSDASSPTIGSAVVGGGSAIAKVFCNGSQWTVIGI